MAKDGERTVHLCTRSVLHICGVFHNEFPGKLRLSHSHNLPTISCTAPAISSRPRMHRIRRLNLKLGLMGEKAKLADERAELDFQNLCASFGESDEEEVNPRLPLAPSTRAIQPTANSPQVHTTGASVTAIPPLSPSLTGHHTFASLDDDGDYEKPQVPVSTLFAEDAIREDEDSLNACAGGTTFLCAGKDDAWWKAEYARRDAAFPREERARKACKRYYQRLVDSAVLRQ